MAGLEEAVKKHLQPFLNLRQSVFATLIGRQQFRPEAGLLVFPSMPGKKSDFARLEAVTSHVIEIEVLEFVWAKSLLDFTKRHVQSWTRWVRRQSLPMRTVIGVVGLIFVAAIVWASVRVSFGVDLAEIVRNWTGGR